MLCTSNFTIILTGKTAKQAEDWRSQCIKSVKASHKLLDILYEGIESENVETDYHDNPDSQSEENLSTVSEKFVNSCSSLVDFLSTSTLFVVKVPVQNILRLVARCVAVSYNDVVSVPSLSELACEVSRLHASALDVLAQLILCCGIDLLPKSRQIYEICMQTLTSASHDNDSNRRHARFSAYQTLNLWLKHASWSRLLAKHLQALLQELRTDIQLRKTTITKVEDVKMNLVEKEVKRKKGRKKKKQNPEQYHDLASALKPLDEFTFETKWDVPVVCEALKLCKLTVENAPFLEVQSLIREIVDATTACQRDQKRLPAPYFNVPCRELLYTFVSSLASTNVTVDDSRISVLTHFQSANRALSLLSFGAHHDPSTQIRTLCANELRTRLFIQRSSFPVIRKSLHDNTDEVKDILEMEREIERITEENKYLKKKLLASEIENQNQTSLLMFLKQKTEKLESENVDKEKKVIKKGSKENDQDLDESENEADDQSVNEVEDEVERNDKPLVDDVKSKPNKTERKSSQDILNQDLTMCVEEDPPFKQNKLKRKHDELEVVNNNKRNKVNESSTELMLCDDPSKTDENLQAMISDFVDADPDT